MPQPIQFNKVADLYDYYVKVDFDIPFFIQEAKKVQGKVLELTSGTGRVSLPLLKVGVDLTCVDYSAEMLAMLQRKLREAGLGCRIYKMDIAELSLPEKFDLIFIPFHSFSEILERTRQQSALRRIQEHLSPSGIFLCTLQNPWMRTKSMDGSLKLVGEFPTESNGFLVVRSQLNYDQSSHIASGKQLYELYDSHKTLQRTITLDINFYLYTKDEFESLVRSAGFQIKELYGDYSYAPFDEEASQFMIWKLRKA